MKTFTENFHLQHLHTVFLVAVQSSLSHHLRELGLSPEDVARHGEVHGRRTKQLHRDAGLTGLLLSSWILFNVLAVHLQQGNNSSSSPNSVIHFQTIVSSDPNAETKNGLFLITSFYLHFKRFFNFWGNRIREFIHLHHQ